MYRTIHLTLSTHPTPISKSAIEYACRTALYFDAVLSVTSPRLSVRTPSHAIASGVLAGLARDFERQAAETSAELEQFVRETAASLGADVRIVPVAGQWPSSPTDMTWRGRASDLCILSLPQAGLEGRLNAEDWLFEVGRPCLLYPEESDVALKLDSILISWDFSKYAARAVGDALPILKTAKTVRVLAVRGEKDIRIEDRKTPILDLLAAHGVKAEFVEVDLGAHSIGCSILDEAHNARADLIVMGAYGHSRLKEFVLGGATKEILSSTRIPLLMSH